MQNSADSDCYDPLTGPGYGITSVSDTYRLDAMFSCFCCYYAAFTWLVYDYLLTLSDEANFCWKRPVRAGTVLFYCLRCLGLASLGAGMGIYLWPEGTIGINPLPPGRHACPVSEEDWYILNYLTEGVVSAGIPGLQFSVFWTVEVVLQARIYAIYNSRKLAILNGVVFLIEIASMAVLWCYPSAFYPAQYASGDDDGSPNGIRNAYALEGFALFWVPGIVFELWLAALALRKLKRKVLKHDLLTVIVHDSIKYFFLVALVMVLHIVAALKQGGEYAIPFAIAGQTIGGSQMILHLRRAYHKTHDYGTGISRRDISFALPSVDNPAPRRRFVDETFYVDEQIGGYSDQEDVGDRDQDIALEQTGEQTASGQ